METSSRDKRVKPAGLGSRDTLRLEMGILYMGRISIRAHTPLEAHFDKFVDLSKIYS